MQIARSPVLSKANATFEEWEYELYTQIATVSIYSKDNDQANLRDHLVKNQRKNCVNLRTGGSGE